jgi:hypothetical protein
MNWKVSTVALARRALMCAAAVGMSSGAHAAVISAGAFASPFIGPVQCQSGFTSPQCTFRAFDTSGDLAFSGGPAFPAIASSTIPVASAIHQAQFINDGFYGNGRSWIGDTANAWLKIDLGSVQTVNQVTFGRDRLGSFDDRDPGQFKIEFALTDAIFASGDSSNDAIEYTISPIDSSALGFSGSINGADTVLVDFHSTPVAARYVKMTFASLGAAIDEVEVSMIPEPSSLALLGGALAAFGLTRRRRKS